MYRKRRTNRKKKTIIILSLLLLMIITVGYAAFSTNLSITARGNIKEYTIDDYIKEGLFAFYDGIENTANGHSTPTDTWYNKALDLNPLLATTSRSTLTGFTTSSWTKDNGLLFNGIDSVVDTGYNQEELGQQITLSFTVYTTSNSIYRGYYGYHQATPTFIGMVAQIGGTQGFSVAYYGNSTNCYVSIPKSEVDSKILNQKINITIVIDAGNYIRLYLDDVKVGETICANKLDPYPDANFMIGRVYPVNTPSNRYFEGTMYNFMIYRKALTEEEVKQNYRVNKQRYNLE